jgi:hypothetical protein
LKYIRNLRKLNILKIWREHNVVSKEIQNLNAPDVKKDAENDTLKKHSLGKVEGLFIIFPV